MLSGSVLMFIIRMNFIGCAPFRFSHRGAFSPDSRSWSVILDIDPDVRPKIVSDKFD